MGAQVLRNRCPGQAGIGAQVAPESAVKSERNTHAAVQWRLAAFVGTSVMAMEGKWDDGFTQSSSLALLHKTTRGRWSHARWQRGQRGDLKTGQRMFHLI